MTKSLPKVFSLALVLALVLSALPVFSVPVQAVSTTVAISEFRVRGPNGGNDEFIEIFNKSASTINIGGWKIKGSNNAAGVGTRVTITAGTMLPAGCYYLMTNSATTAGPYSGSVPGNQTYGTGITDDGGIALTMPDDTVVDMVGMSAGSAFKEGTPLANLGGTTASNLNRGYERKPGGASGNGTDTDNNSSDFQLLTPSNPQNLASPCQGSDAAPSVTGTVPMDDAVDVARATDISIAFSETVNVNFADVTISCVTSGLHTFTFSGGPTTFILNPDLDFAANERCDVTIPALSVKDQDGNDPPDTMVASFTTGFTTINLQVCGDPATLIHDIQGPGLLSPFNGATNVSIEGIVIADYQGSGQFSGYYVQEEDADADANPSTSEGIFVFNTGFPVNAGDKVRVRGNVLEFMTSGVPLTELTSVTNVQICSAGNASPAPASVDLPVDTLDDWEAFEGMLINIPQTLTVTETFTLARFGEVSLSVNGRLFNPTNIVAPGALAIAQQELNDRSRIVLDDANNQQNIDPTIYPAGGLSASNTLRSGDTVNGITGVLEQRFGVYRVQPVGSINFNASNPRPAAPEAVGGQLKVSAMNVLNYFNGNGLGGGFPTARGANTLIEFDRQRAKTVSAITTMDADIIGLMELENDAPGNSAIEDLVSGLNAATAPGTYAFINTGVVGTDAIRVALIYKTATVTPLGAFAILDSTVDPNFIDTKNRPTLAQTFEQNSNGALVTVAVNHLKSKGSDCNDVSDPDTGDGQGNCNITRTKAATALVNWLATDPTDAGDADFLIIGDLNSYAIENPITAIKNAGYTNLLSSIAGAYSYVFQGQSGYLDHALASNVLTPQVSGVTEWHINADEPIALDYNLEFKSLNHQTTLYAGDPFRSSDHDPVLVGLDLLHYNFTGFFQPIDNAPVFNVVKGGSSVPVKFSLGGDQGLDIFFNGYPLSQQIACESNASFDSIEQTVTAGGSSLSYDSLTDQYVYVWKTEKSWVGTCRQLVVTLKDGSIHTANFKFK